MFYPLNSWILLRERSSFRILLMVDNAHLPHLDDHHSDLQMFYYFIYVAAKHDSRHPVSQRRFDCCIHRRLSPNDLQESHSLYRKRPRSITTRLLETVQPFMCIKNLVFELEVVRKRYLNGIWNKLC